MGVEFLRRATACAAFAAVFVMLMAGCGGGDAPDTGHGREVTVKERDFRISAPKRVAAGPVDLRVDNEGPDAHELVVVRGSKTDLRISRDGINVDEEQLEKRGAKELEAADPGTRTLKLKLRPGRYVLLCNMTGHFKGGMHTEVLVR